MTKKQHYMTYDERCKLEALLDAKKPVAWIAQHLGFCRQTIYNEIHCGKYVHSYDYYDRIRYSADKAQEIHDHAQTRKGAPLKIGHDHAYARFLEDKIVKDRMSPAAALAEARKEDFDTSISVNTLYSYIEKGIFLHVTNKDLWEKSKKKEKKKNKVVRIAHPKLPSISERPEAAENRSEYGHWEMDLIVGKKGSSHVLLTLTERKTRKERIFKLPNRKAKTIRRVFDRLEKEITNFKEEFKSITTDNGTEFMQYEKLQRSIHGGKRFEVYYCHSYAAWEKGSNENHNKMIRRWFPKGTDFGRITRKEIQWVEDWMNRYPRKILDWKTPLEAAAA